MTQPGPNRRPRWRYLTTSGLVALATLAASADTRDLAAEATRNGRLATRAFVESQRVMHAWLARRDAVSGLLPHRGVFQNSRPDPGWVVANLWFSAKLGKALSLSGGIENLFDRRYADHLAGRNRVTLSDVAVGEKLPTPGRSVFVRLGLDF